MLAFIFNFNFYFLKDRMKKEKKIKFFFNSSRVQQKKKGVNILEGAKLKK